MAKVAAMTIPPDFQVLLDKITNHFDQMIYPTWASQYFHLSRSIKKANIEKSFLPHIHDLWSVLTPAQKQLWKDAKAYTGYSGYQLYTADYSYRRKNNLITPGTPYTTHQMHGLKITNPGGTENIRIRLHFKDLVGPLTIAFNYRKQQYSAPSGQSFNFTATAYYFDAGLNISVTKDWESPTGDVAWATVSETFGTSQRKYFHLTLEFKLDDYDADVFLDNLSITDNGGLFYGDSFVKKSGKEWIYEAFYRKQGWAFDPSFIQPYFEVVYLDS